MRSNPASPLFVVDLLDGPRFRRLPVNVLVVLALRFASCLKLRHFNRTQAAHTVFASHSATIHHSEGHVGFAASCRISQARRPRSCANASRMVRSPDSTFPMISSSIPKWDASLFQFSHRPQFPLGDPRILEEDTLAVSLLTVGIVCVDSISTHVDNVTCFTLRFTLPSLCRWFTVSGWTWPLTSLARGVGCFLNPSPYISLHNSLTAGCRGQAHPNTQQ